MSSIGTVVVEDGVVRDHVCDWPRRRHGSLVSKKAARQSLCVEIRVFDSMAVETREYRAHSVIRVSTACGTALV